MKTQLPLAMLVGLFVAAGCRDNGGDDSGNPIDTAEDTAVETDTDTDTDTDTGVPADAPEGFAFCSAGGMVAGADVNGVLCLGPLDVAGGLVEGSQYTWQAGPIYILAP